jgi:hypothetical protein
VRRESLIAPKKYHHEAHEGHEGFGIDTFNFLIITSCSS